MHLDGEPVTVLSAWQSEPARVVLRACSTTRRAAEHGLERIRFCLGVDEDMLPFCREFAHDPLIGASVRRRPWLRVGRRPDPFEALGLAICEQLIDYDSAAEIQRRVVARLGRCCPASGLRDFPTAAAVADTAPARLQAMNLSAARSLAFARAAREVVRGRLDLHGADHEQGWRRLRAIPGIGSWTVERMALHGQGRNDQVPAGDLAYLKLAGRLLSGGDPQARASEDEVRELFAPYGEWAGLAATHALGGPVAQGR